MSYRTTPSGSLYEAVRLISGYRCTVKTPSGNSFNAEIIRPVDDDGSIGTYVVSYPDDFGGSDPLAPGDYRVEWLSSHPIPAGTRRLSASLAGAERIERLVATDSFTIPAQQGE